MEVVNTKPAPELGVRRGLGGGPRRSWLQRLYWAPGLAPVGQGSFSPLTGVCWFHGALPTRIHHQVQDIQVRDGEQEGQWSLSAWCAQLRGCLWNVKPNRSKCRYIVQLHEARHNLAFLFVWLCSGGEKEGCFSGSLENEKARDHTVLFFRL